MWGARGEFLLGVTGALDASLTRDSSCCTGRDPPRRRQQATARLFALAPLLVFLLVRSSEAGDVADLYSYQDLVEAAEATVVSDFVLKRDIFLRGEISITRRETVTVRGDCGGTTCTLNSGGLSRALVVDAPNLNVSSVAFANCNGAGPGGCLHATTSALSIVGSYFSSAVASGVSFSGPLP